LCGPVAVDPLRLRVAARFLSGEEATPAEISRKIKKWEADIRDWEQLAKNGKVPGMVETLSKFRNHVQQLRKELAAKSAE